MDWKSFGLGLLAAVLYAALDYAKLLPPPYGAIAGGLAIILANFLPAASPKLSAFLFKK